MRTNRSKFLTAALILPMCGLVSLASCGPKSQSTLVNPEPTLTPTPTKTTADAPQVPQETAPIPVNTVVDQTPAPTPIPPSVTLTSTTVGTPKKMDDNDPDPDEPIPPVATPPPVTPLSNPLVTQGNLDRVHKDMSPAQVVAILGSPTSSETTSIPIFGGTETSYHYQTGFSTVNIIFRNNEVKFKDGKFGDD